MTVGGEEVALTQREFDLLAFLARHPGRAFSREELMEQVWRFSFYTDTATVTVHIRRLRTKLDALPGRRRPDRDGLGRRLPDGGGAGVTALARVGGAGRGAR